MKQIIKTIENLINPIEMNFRFSVINVLLVLSFLSTASAQWNTQSPIPTFLDVRGVGAPAAQRVFVATDDNSFDDGGSLFESTDGGSTWVQRNIPTSLADPFNGIFFIDSQNGWAYGNNNYRTTDGGTNWTQLPFLGSTYFMKFSTTNFGVTSGNFGIYISRDGGLSWNPSPNDIFAFDFIDNQTGLGVSSNGIYKTTDAGITFTSVRTGEAAAVRYLSNTDVVGIVDNIFVKSTDGGETWTTGNSAEGKSNLVKVNGDVVLAYGRAGTFPDYDDRVFRSTDGGQTWTDLGEIINPISFTAYISFAVPSPQTVVATDGSGNMFYSSDAGQNWLQVYNAPNGIQPGFLSSAVPVFADALTGYFGYGPGFVIKTTNAGESWSQISSGTGQSLNDIDRFTNGNMIAVGDNGTVLTKLSGASQWILEPAISQYNVKAVQIISPSEVVMVDENGQVYLSSDGGASWTAASTVPAGMSPAEDIHFNTLLDGWVIGQGGSALYHTDNGGNTWIPVPDFGGAYVSVDAEGQSIWANNITGLFYRSTDNGSTWISGVLPNAPFQIMDMDFIDENIGYAVGWGGKAYRSIDGGANWDILPTPNSDDQLTDIYLVGPNELWISTNSNKVYYSASGGQSWAMLDIGSSGFGNFSAITASPDGDAWTVGFEGYIEHFTGPPPPPLNQPPTAAFDYNSNGLTVNLTDASTDLDGSIVSWGWNFGDGFFSTEQNPLHTYNNADTYIVRLKVIDDDGAADSTIRIMTVQPNPGGTFGDFTEVTPLDSIFVTPQDEDFWVVTTAPADFDNDGDLDIAVMGYYVVYNQSVEERLLILVNNGPLDSVNWNFSYVNVSLGSLTTGASDMAWGDADGDGDLDLAVGSDDLTVIYRNDAGTLNLTDTNLPGYWEDNSQAEFDLKSIVWVDFDNDSDFDLLIPSVFDIDSFSFRTALMRNDGLNGTGGFIFTEVDSVFAPTKHASSMWADFDNDTDLDLLLVNMVPNTDESFITRYRNDGNGVFTGENIIDSIAVEHGEAQWGDYDSDGDLDILVAGNLIDANGIYTLALRIYRNDNENYVPIEVISCVPCEGWFDLTAASWADYDSDGDMDILLAGNYNSGSNIEGRARIYTNSGGIFTPDTANTLPAPRAAGDRGGTFSWFDIDGDGDLDYFIAGQYFVPGGNGLVEAQMHLYRNDTPGQNNAPLTPTNLNAAVQNDNTVILSWSGSSDDHTPSLAITYDLDLFKDGLPVAMPNRLPEPGNISAATQWLITDLADGDYEWTLRAVDASYSGSLVTTGTFSIGVSSTEGLSDNLPKEFSLSQNYPNPFNPVSLINYSISKEGPVMLKIYNSLGEEVTTLVDEVKQIGNYSVIFDAKNYSSGVYFYRLQSGTFVQTRKMILLR